MIMSLGCHETRPQTHDHGAAGCVLAGQTGVTAIGMRAVLGRTLFWVCGVQVSEPNG